MINAQWLLSKSNQHSNNNTAVVIFESDAVCVNNTHERLVKDILPSLPNDWDVLFIGGKPFSIYKAKRKDGVRKNTTHEEFERLMCAGAFGTTSTGPFAPDGSRNLSLSQPYWIIRSIWNTQSVVYNPASLSKILNIITKPSPVREKNRPIDVALGDAFEAGALRAYMIMTTQDYCVQNRQLTKPIKSTPKKRLKVWDNIGPAIEPYWYEMFIPSCLNKP